MKGKRLLAGSLVICLLLCACSARSNNVQIESADSPSQRTEHLQESSVDEAPNAASYELPNGWQLSDFSIAGFDKEGPGDFGYRVALDEGQISRLAELLDVESWKELNTPIEYGLTAHLTVADEGIGRFMAILDGGDLGSIIALWENGDSEKLVYTAPAQVVKEAKALADELEGQTGHASTMSMENSADIRYPELVSDDLAADPLYLEASKDGYAVIQVNGEVITSEKPVTSFLERYKNGESCKLNIYCFREGETWMQAIHYDREADALYEIYSKAVEVADGSRWGEELIRIPIDEISLTESGCVCVKGESSGGDPVYTQVISDYDLFDNYDRMVELAQQYVTPIYFCTVVDATFSSPNEIVNWMEILERIVSMECAEDESFWTFYPEGKVSVDEMMRQLSKYFEVDKETVLSKIKPYMLDDTTVQYEGGLGGAYPYVLVYDLQKNGDTSTILCRHRSAITGDVDMERGYLITVKNMPDGSFRYLSMEEYVD